MLYFSRRVPQGRRLPAYFVLLTVYPRCSSACPTFMGMVNIDIVT